MANWTPAGTNDPEPGFVLATAEGRLRAVLPEAKRLCARQHRSAIWNALVAAEGLLGELEDARSQASPGGLDKLAAVRRYADECRSRGGAQLDALTVAATLRGLVGEGK